MNKPVIAITQGDPAGIGPEIARKAIKHSRVLAVCHPLIIDLPKETSQVPIGRSSALGGRLSYEALCCAVALAKRGNVQGIVTAPIDKRSWEMAGVRFPGHTEALATLTGTKRFAMMFVDKKLKISLVTRHLPLLKVPKAITRSAVLEAVELTVEALQKYFGMKCPRVVVLGLNPHGGQDNLFGSEERTIIAPALHRLRKKLKAELIGPVPADSAFREEVMRNTNAYIAMYHDQGLIPFKMLAFERGVNVTIGLPFIRTSPDHGTAYDLAGKGQADPTSMIEAVVLAARMALKRR